MKSIVLFRNDLRLDDNEAIARAARAGHVLPVYIHDSESITEQGGATKVWLHHSLQELSRRIGIQGGTLVLHKGDTASLLTELCSTLDIRNVYVNERFDPRGIAADKNLLLTLKEQQIDLHICSGNVLCHPNKPTNKEGAPFKVFTPFYRWYQQNVLLGIQPPKPCNGISFLKVDSSVSIVDLSLLPSIPWYRGILQAWTPGEKQADFILDRFIDGGLRYYQENRDFPAVDGVSALSPFLHFGEISPQRIVWEVFAEEKLNGKSEIEAVENSYVRQLVWREFATYLLFHFPATETSPFNDKFVDFPWQHDSDHFAKWQRGQTGYPLVDAGMRELWTTGWMHNRVRMVVASFLTKHLLLDWQLGAAWFMDTLVDADTANNTMGWQWVAGCGADAAPYFRVFNPILQSKKFDPDGEYIRRWVPELRNVPSPALHEPWLLGESKESLFDAENPYPSPIVEHSFARKRALNAYEQIK